MSSLGSTTLTFSTSNLHRNPPPRQGFVVNATPGSFYPDGAAEEVPSGQIVLDPGIDWQEPSPSTYLHRFLVPIF